MSTTNRRKKRRGDALHFAYAGPFAPLIDPRVGRALPLTKERYTATSAENYTIGSRVGEAITQALVDRFGSAASRVRPRRRRRRGGARRDTA